MSATEQQIRIASKLYECRDAARTLLGDNYRPRMDELGTVLNRIAEVRKVGVLEAAQDAVKAVVGDGMTQLQILAAAVELIEPTV